MILYRLSGFNFQSELSQSYIQNGIQDTGAINIVSSILFDYRGFDTLGEATVIFAVAASISLLVTQKKVPMLSARFTIIVYRIILLILPVLAMLGIYLIMFGHLSPGGGFTGGVLLATIPILLTITYGSNFTQQKFPPDENAFIEGVGAILFIALGLIGIAAGKFFLTNGQAGLGLGQPGRLFSAGIIPYLNLAVGLKVGAGLTLIFYSLIREN